MAELKPSNITSLVSKKARRAKARLMQNLGKGPDRTEDEIFEVYQSNFFRQQSSALRLHKELKNYTNCLITVQEARQSLNQCLLELHEKDWTKHQVFADNIIEIDYVGDNLIEKFRESIMVPVEQYLSQFAEVRDKIAKRGRKLVDYDGSRHNFEALRATYSVPGTRKPSDDAKLAKARDQMEESKRVYETLNSELHEELPSLYDNRLPLIISVLQRLYSAEMLYHSQSLNVYKNLNEAVEHLARRAQCGVYNMSGRQNLTADLAISTSGPSIHETSRPAPIGSDTDHKRQSIHNPSDTKINNDQDRTNINGSRHSSVEHNRNPASNYSSSTINPAPDPDTRDAGDQLTSGGPADSNVTSSIRSNQKVSNALTTTVSEIQRIDQPRGELKSIDATNKNENDESVIKQAATTTTLTSKDDSKQTNQSSTDQAVEAAGIILIPENATTTDLPAGVLYRVKASYKYMAEDDDELSFEAGETIQVINYDDPAEQEEGWLMGIRELNGQRGLFPANFTRVI
ncbi:Amphiphysin [Fragariocoptes setiger]|uniref:Amphiphysin n=1 Tax=Fragariocoptes setiger TaxID=1670756 RepID=A0ABQ7S976_9ACAR|nr:Amphiphysin [Fragariocoptes setiger]